jgi:hypothetical protein
MWDSPKHNPGCAGLLLNKATVGQDVITEDDSKALSRRAT